MLKVTINIKKWSINTLFIKKKLISIIYVNIATAKTGQNFINNMMRYKYGIKQINKIVRVEFLLLYFFNEYYKPVFVWINNWM